ncbi:hypothetical protein CONCODRAFT_10016 [Conidiobolus coronatus NRRL 28638]|uniref:DNA-directed RNA polymerase n=1 Tax=Conidiobolus coronatus (strain ATCC 28846 / CBS 209.66 / NRRL 28638) TaxID=796925 RepID=A0A137NYG2_CONC2|nr:hypothetical protein CONCODRAFT_10016 [Conidiobolus coronatus NRRL 28638]|eukprot:KXN67835.1 hypothetical protein CONCODRAFT_10016 [Conidiobolus coronatus NRRL 28638]
MPIWKAVESSRIFLTGKSHIHHYLGFAASLIPLLHHNASAREVFMTNMLKQTLESEGSFRGQKIHPENPILEQQLKVAQFMVANDRLLLFHSLGSGKSITALSCARYNKKNMIFRSLFPNTCPPCKYMRWMTLMKRDRSIVLESLKNSFIIVDDAHGLRGGTNSQAFKFIKKGDMKGYVNRFSKESSENYKRGVSNKRKFYIELANICLESRIKQDCAIDTIKQSVSNTKPRFYIYCDRVGKWGTEYLETRVRELKCKGISITDKNSRSVSIRGIENSKIIIGKNIIKVYRFDTQETQASGAFALTKCSSRHSKIQSPRFEDECENIVYNRYCSAEGCSQEFISACVSWGKLNNHNIQRIGKYLTIVENYSELVSGGSDSPFRKQHTKFVREECNTRVGYRGSLRIPYSSSMTQWVIQMMKNTTKNLQDVERCMDNYISYIQSSNDVDFCLSSSSIDIIFNVDSYQIKESTSNIILNVVGDRFSNIRVGDIEVELRRVTDRRVAGPVHIGCKPIPKELCLESYCVTTWCLTGGYMNDIEFKKYNFEFAYGYVEYIDISNKEITINIKYFIYPYTDMDLDVTIEFEYIEDKSLMTRLPIIEYLNDNLEHIWTVVCLQALMHLVAQLSLTIFAADVVKCPNGPETSGSSKQNIVAKDCRTITVDHGDGCDKLAQRCGISRQDFDKYNPKLCVISNPDRRCAALMEISQSPSPQTANARCIKLTVVNGVAK